MTLTPDDADSLDMSLDVRMRTSVGTAVVRLLSIPMATSLILLVVLVGWVEGLFRAGSNPRPPPKTKLALVPRNTPPS